MSNEKEYKPITIWVKGETQPQKFKTALEALKQTKVMQSATSASIEIVERLTNDGSTITSSQHATLRHWADSEISAIANGAKQLNFRDTKYVPVEYKLDRESGEEKVYPARLVFKASAGRE